MTRTTPSKVRYYYGFLQRPLWRDLRVESEAKKRGEMGSKAELIFTVGPGMHIRAHMCFVVQGVRLFNE